MAMRGTFPRISPRAGRLALLLLVVAAAAPGTWLRSEAGELAPDDRQELVTTRLSVPTGRIGQFEVAGAWQLDSNNRHFGSFSAMEPLGNGRLLAVSDNGHRLEFTPPDSGTADPRFDFLTGPITQSKRSYDSESLTRDPQTGLVWAGFEGTNSVVRFGPDLKVDKRFSPPAMEDWPGNGGPETMVRLRDGRFIILAEDDPEWAYDDTAALLFPGDPVEGAAPTRFRFQPTEGFLAVDMAQVPDGKVLILLRRLKWRIPQRFEGQLVLADPAEIRERQVWSGKVVAEIDEPVPTDNYEGLAITPMAAGAYAAWLISDDNSSSFQRTLLLKLVWRPTMADMPKGVRN